MAKKHKMTAGALSGVGRLEKIGKKPRKPGTLKAWLEGEGESSKLRSDKAPRR